MWEIFRRTGDNPVPNHPCPECGAAADQWSVSAELQDEWVVIEAICRNCGFSQAEKIPERRQHPR